MLRLVTALIVIVSNKRQADIKTNKFGEIELIRE